MKFLLGLILGILIVCLMMDSFAARQYTINRESIVSFEDESLPVLNNVLRSVWYAIDGLDDRVYDLENP